MDQIAQLKETDIQTILSPTIEIFIPLLEKKRTEILSIPKQTFQYGETERHMLDIYYPPNVNTGAKTKILFWIYGGGFVSGDRIFPPPADLCYTNVGAYFAQKGFIVVIPDYRLVPHVKFPEPARDVRDAMEWIVTHPEHLIFASVTEPDTDQLFVMGHSAGAAHTFTVLAYPELYSPILHPRIKGALLFSGPYSCAAFEGQKRLEEVVALHWGSLKEAYELDPAGLLAILPADKVVSLPNIALLVAEKDGESFHEAADDFHNALLDRKLKVKRIHAKVHNHISVSWCLGTGQGEEWAEEVVKWIGTL